MRAATAECLKKVKFTTDFVLIDAVLQAHVPIAQRNLQFALASEPLNIGLGTFNRDETIA